MKQQNNEQEFKQNLETTQVNNEDLSTESIDGTPFKLTGNETIGWIITLGKYRLTEFKNTKDEALNELADNTWLIIERMIGSMIHHMIINTDSLLTPTDKPIFSKITQ